MNDVINIRDKKRIKKLESTIGELQGIIKALELAKKNLLGFIQYSGVKKLVVEIDDRRVLYQGLYKKAKYEIRILNGEKIDE